MFYGSNKAPIICNKSGTGGSAELAKAPIGTFAHIEYPGALFGCPEFDGLEGEENIVLTDNVSMSRGRHQLKFGVQANQVRTIVDATNFNEGFWSHPTDRLFDRSDPATYPDLFSGLVSPTLAKWSQWNSYYYAQDTWQATDALTLNLGLRYDVDRSATAGNDFVDAKNARIVQRFGGGPLLQKAKVDYNNVAPRLGVRLDAHGRQADDDPWERRRLLRPESQQLQRHLYRHTAGRRRHVLQRERSAREPVFRCRRPGGSAAALRAFSGAELSVLPGSLAGADRAGARGSARSTPEGALHRSILRGRRPRFRPWTHGRCGLRARGRQGHAGVCQRQRDVRERRLLGDRSSGSLPSSR